MAANLSLSIHFDLDPTCPFPIFLTRHRYQFSRANSEEGRLPLSDAPDSHKDVDRVGNANLLCKGLGPLPILHLPTIHTSPDHKKPYTKAKQNSHKTSGAGADVVCFWQLRS